MLAATLGGCGSPDQIGNHCKNDGDGVRSIGGAWKMPPLDESFDARFGSSSVAVVGVTSERMRSFQRDQLLREPLHHLRVGPGPTRVDPDITALGPPELLEWQQVSAKAIGPDVLIVHGTPAFVGARLVRGRPRGAARGGQHG